MDKRLAALTNASAKIFAARSLDETLRLITEAARDVVGAHQAVTSLTTGDDWAQAIHTVLLSEKYAAWRNDGEKPQGTGIYAALCRTNEPVRLTQAELEARPEWRGSGAAKSAHPPMRGLLAVPLVARSGAKLGLIGISDKYDGEFDAGDEAVLVQLARLAVLAIENQHLIEAAQAAERRFEAFAAVGSNVLWETDAQHRYTVFLAKGSFRMRRSPHSFIGKTRWDAIGANPADPFWAAHIADLDAHRPIRGFEYATTMGDGSVHYLRLNAEPRFDAAGRFTGYRGATQDVTELRAAEAAAKANEERFHEFANLGSDVLWETDANHRCTFISARPDWQVQSPLKEYLGATRWDAIGADPADPFWRAHIADLEAHRPIRGFEYTVRAADGGLRYIQVHGQPRFDVSGRFLGYRGATTDITAARSAEASARANEERFRQFAEIASDWLWETDAQHRIIFFAGAAGRLDREPYGLTRWELAGADVADPKWRAHIADLEAGRPFRNFEYEITDTAGRRRYVSVSGQPVRAADGSLAGYRGTATDLTREREAEAKAQDAAERYRAIVETANEGLWVFDREMRIQFANRCAAEMLGYTVEEVIGRSLIDFVPADRVEEARRNWKNREAGMPGRFEARYRRKDGSELWTIVSATPRYDADGVFDGAISMFVDISAAKRAEEALKHSEQRYRTIVEFANEGLCTFDRDMRIEFINRRGAEIFGYAPEEFLGRPLTDFVPPERRDAVRRNWNDRRAGIGGRYEATYRHRDGHDIWLLVSTVPGHDADGAFSGATSMFVDISDRKRAETALKLSEERFREFAEMGSDWIWETDAEHRITLLHGPSPTVRGFAIGKRRWEYGGVDPEAPQWKQLRADMDARRPFRKFEYDAVGKLGERRYFSINGKPVFGAQGAFLGYRGATTDITALREAERKARASEERFKDFAEVASDWMWETDAEHRFSYFSPSRDSSQPDPSNAALGRTRWEFAIGDLSAPHWQAHLADLAAHRPFRGFEYQYRRPDGSEGTYVVSGVPIFAENGVFAGYRGTTSDITAQRAAEAAARHREREYRLIVETAHEGIWMLDADRRTTYVNPRMAEMLGYAAEEMLGRHHWDFMAPEDRAAAIESTRQRPEDGVERAELRYLRKDGTPIWAIVTSNVVEDPSRGARGVLGMVTDITDRKRAEQSAAASEARFRDFAEVASDWMWETDAEHRLTFISGTALSIENEPFGRTRWDLAGADADHPAWREHVAVLEARRPFRDFEFTVTGKSGRTHHLVASGRPIFDDQGNFAGYRGTTTNRTQQREAEAAAAASDRQFRQLVETAQEGIWIFDADFGTAYVNPRMAEMLGYTLEEIGRRPFLEFQHREDRPRTLEAWDRYARSGVKSYEQRLRHKDGSDRWTLASATPRHDAEGKFVGVFAMLVDITDRKHAEETAARAKRELDAILASTSDGVTAFDNDWRYTYVNAAGERIMKVAANDVVGKVGFDLFDVGDDNVFRRCYLEAKRDNEPVWFTGRSTVFDGWHEIRAYPHSEGLTVFFRDVTGERLAHVALAESEGKLRAALETNQSILASISDGFVALDNEWRFAYINAAAERMWKRKAEDLLGKTIFNSLQVDQTNPFQSNYLESKRTGDPVAFTAYSQIFGMWLEVRGYPHAGGYTFFFHDVTEERDAHRELLKNRRKLEAAREMNERIFETSLDLICITDREGNFLRVNPGAGEQFGYPVEDLVGKNASMFIDGEGIAATRAAMREARRSRRQQTFENKCLRRDGTWVPMNWSVAWSEREAKYFLIGRDMTERIATQERLNRSQRLEAIGQLTGGIAHDFNNLLTVIMGNSDSLARGLQDRDQLRRRAELSLEAARRAAELTAQLLAFARRQTLAPKAVDANRLVRDMHELVQRSLGAEIDIHFVPAPSLWLCKVDSTQLETALLNLALNARDAMAGGGRLTISTSNRGIAPDGADGIPELAAGDYVAIEVADTGTGMTPTVMARVFEPFFTTKDVGKGSGLGLAMVYGFVKQSGGHVAIESAPGRGTKVTLYLPRAADTAATATPSPARVGAALPGGKETILVVEDDSAVRELVTEQLRNLGYRVLVAGNGPTARNIVFGGERIDLLFTDVMMPGGVTGTQLATEAEQHLPGLRVLFTTGYSDVPVLKQARKGVSLLRKPYKTHDLALTVRQALDAA